MGKPVNGVAQPNEGSATLHRPDEAPFIEPPFLSQVGLFLTLRCNIRCRHCMVKAGPKRTEQVTITEIDNWLHQMADYGGIRSVGFTGGEPFHCWDTLVYAAETAQQLGFLRTVVTNGFWADSGQITYDKLTELQLDGLSVSTDVYHAEFIPLENVRRVYQACAELKIPCNIIVAYESRNLEASRRILDDILTFAPENALRLTRVFPSGRGMRQADFNDGSGKVQGPSTIPCIFASAPYIATNGDVFSCVGPNINLRREHNPLFLGSLREQSLADIFEASRYNPILQGLRLWGIQFWQQLIQTSGPQSHLPEGYHTNCPCEGCITLLNDPVIGDFLCELSHSQPLGDYVNRARQTVLDEV